MGDALVVLVLVGMVLLVLLGQWLVGRRVALARGPVPEALAEACPEATWVVFVAPRCPACHRFRRTLAPWEEANPGRICLIDVSDEPALAGACRVIGVPTRLRIEGDRIVEAAAGEMASSAWRRLAVESGLDAPQTREEEPDDH
jgi:hypothetical protein